MQAIGRISSELSDVDCQGDIPLRHGRATSLQAIVVRAVLATESFESVQAALQGGDRVAWDWARIARQKI